MYFRNNIIEEEIGGFIFCELHKMCSVQYELLKLLIEVPTPPMATAIQNDHGADIQMH